MKLPTYSSLIAALALVFSVCFVGCSSDGENADLMQEDPSAPVVTTYRQGSKKGSLDGFKGRVISFSDFGAADLGFISLPQTPPQYGVLFVPDAPGLDDVVRETCDYIASKGQTAVAVDLYNGRVARTPRESQIMREDLRLRRKNAIQAVHASLELLSDSPRFNTPHIVIAAYGHQGELVMEALRDRGKLPENLVGFTWFEPQGEFDADDFRHLTLPMLVVVEAGRAGADTIIGEIRDAMTDERKPITIIEEMPGHPGFVLFHEGSIAHQRAWEESFDFWLRCSQDQYKRD